MLHHHRGLVLAVERPAAGIVVVRVAGPLDRSTAPRLLRLLDNLLGGFAPSPDAEPPIRRGHVIVDLAGVNAFGEGGLNPLRHACHIAEAGAFAMHVTGLTARAGLLPSWMIEHLPGFNGYPAVEDAVAAVSADLTKDE